MQALHVENCRGITPIKYTHRLVVDHTVSSYNLVHADEWVIYTEVRWASRPERLFIFLLVLKGFGAIHFLQVYIHSV